MIEEEKYVECCEHGKQQSTYVCQHIVQSLENGEPRGFCCSTESPNNPRPDAWCNECEVRVNEAGEWNDETEALQALNFCVEPAMTRQKSLI